MKLKFQKTPKCEITGKPATYFVHQGPKGPATRAKVAELKEGEPLIKFLKPCEISDLSEEDEYDQCPHYWKFVAVDAPEYAGDYHFEIAEFFKSPTSTVDWLAHLHEKDWFDANDFCAMLHRFRKATGSYGIL